MSKGIHMAMVLLPYSGLRFPNQNSSALFARMMDIHSISASAVSNMSEEFELRLLGSLVDFPMARAFLVRALSFRLVLLAISPKGSLTCLRMVCLLLGLCTIALFVREMGIKIAFAIGVPNASAVLGLLGRWMFIALLMA